MTETTRELGGQVALVTGAGRVIAIAYAQAGTAVCGAAWSMEEMTVAVRAIEASGGRALAMPADVTCGELAILVINAGGNYDRRHVAMRRDT